MEILFNKIKRKLILDNYYSGRIKNGKTTGASLLDWIFIIFILGIFFLISIFNSTKNIILSIVLTFVLISVQIFIFFILFKKRRRKEINKIQENLCNEEVLKAMEKLNSREYILYIKEILEKHYNAEFREMDEDIDFIGEINGEEYGIKCFKSSLDNIITEKDIKNYHLSMEMQGIEYGIIISNTYFQEDLKDKFDYILIDFDFLKKILKELEEYPDKEEIEELILLNHKNKRMDLIENIKRSKKEKIYKLGLLGVLLFLFSSYTSFPLYYKISGLILVFIGIILGINRLVVFLQTNKDSYSK